MPNAGGSQETIESLTEVIKGLFEVLGQHAHLIAALIRALEAAEIDIPDLYSLTSHTH